MKTFITIGYHLTKSEFKPNLNTENLPMKPDACIWCCEYENDIVDTHWYRFCKDNAFCDNDGTEFFKIDDYTKVTIFNLKHDAKILNINSKKDLKKLPISKSCPVFPDIDFKTISKDYDALCLTEKGYNTVHDFYRERGTASLYGWDMPSMAIFNFDCIDTDSIKHTIVSELLDK